MSGTPLQPSPKIAYLTAGAAGMYCGSCMHDNTLARVLSRKGVNIELIPTYTPIRTDEENVSIDRVFFGGVNIFMQQKIPLLKHLPLFLDRWLDNPRFLRWISSRAMDVSPQELGALTVSMLKGRAGAQRKEVRRLCDWLAQTSKPELVVLTNILIGGCIPALKQRLDVPVLVTLQGDDIFLDELPSRYQSAALQEIRRLIPQVDGFLVNSRFYAQHMGQYFGIPEQKIHVVPLAIDTDGFSPTAHDSDQPGAPSPRPPTIGYLARLAPEKGLHLLVEAFIYLKSLVGMEETRLMIAGWLGAHQRPYAEEQFNKLRQAGLEKDFEYLGEIDRAAKIRMLQSIDLFSVPTTYQEPKGLYVLEALAAGAPVVQPDHGSFPELLSSLGGGRLFRPNDPVHLAETWAELIRDEPVRRQLAAHGQRQVREKHGAEALAAATLEVYQRYLNPPW